MLLEIPHIDGEKLILPFDKITKLNYYQKIEPKYVAHQHGGNFWKKIGYRLELDFHKYLVEEIRKLNTYESIVKNLIDCTYNCRKTSTATLELLPIGIDDNSWERSVKFTSYIYPVLEITYTELYGEIHGSGSIKGGGSVSGNFMHFRGSSYIRGSSKMDGEISGVKKITLAGSLAEDVYQFLNKELKVVSFVKKESK